MENEVTRPMENAIVEIANAKHIASRITLGASITSIEFEPGTDLGRAEADVRNAMERLRAELPPHIDRIAIDTPTRSSGT